MAQQFITGSMPNNTNIVDAPYVHQPYPSYRWHKDGATRLIQNADEDSALGDGWADTPFPCHPESNQYVAPAGKIMTSVDLKTEAHAVQPPVSLGAVPTPEADKPAPKKRGRKPKVKPEGV